MNTFDSLCPQAVQGWSHEASATVAIFRSIGRAYELRGVHEHPALH